MSALSDIVAKFRKGSPNIAAAFDEVERRLVALEQTPPPQAPNVTSRAQLEAALATGHVNITCGGFDIAGQLNLHNVSGTIDWGGVWFIGGGTRDLNGVWVRTNNLHMKGGLVSNPTGHGILFHESIGCSWRGFKVDGVGGSGVRVFGPGGPVVGLELDGEVTNVGRDLSLDPHKASMGLEPGTGLHPLYCGGVGYPVIDGRFTIYAHDCATGSVQIGQNRGSKFWIKAKNLTKNATQQTAGNACQPFGSVQDCEMWVEADNVAKILEPTWLDNTARNIIVHPKGTNVRNPPGVVPHPAVTIAA